MTGSAGEMPFLDHLEELRLRILRSLAAVVVGFAIGLWVVQRFQLVTLLKAPIAPYLTGGKLIVTSPTEPVMIVFKLGFVVGLVLASPIILWQLWAFLAPALYEREKKALVPVAVRRSAAVPHRRHPGLSVRGAAGAPGAVQLPERGDRAVHHLRRLLRLRAPGGAGARDLVRAAAGHGHPLLARGDRAGGAAPVPPLRRRLLLRRRGRAVARGRPALDDHDDGAAALPLRGRCGRLRHRAPAAAQGRPRIAALVLLALGVGATPGLAQEPVRAGRPTADSLRGADTLETGLEGEGDQDSRPGQSLDSATARRLGLPTAPSRSFAQPDSVVNALLNRQGYRPTRYRADSATVFVGEPAGPAPGPGSDRATGGDARGRLDHLSARQLPAGGLGRSAPLRRGAGAGGRRDPL